MTIDNLLGGVLFYSYFSKISNCIIKMPFYEIIIAYNMIKDNIHVKRRLLIAQLFLFGFKLIFYLVTAQGKASRGKLHHHNDKS